MRLKRSILCITVLAVLAGGVSISRGGGRRMQPPDSGGAGTGGQTLKELLGEAVFLDSSLSTPDGQSCASCHLASAGFADPDWLDPVSAGATAGRYGNRNAPSIAYCALTPTFHYDAERGEYIGGLFRDGRAAHLRQQASQPFFNPLEMNNPSRLAVVNEVRASHYADLFERVYGVNVWDDVERAFDRLVDAVVAYMRSPGLRRFDSKFDHYLGGDPSVLSAMERRGLELFEGRAGCSDCHPSRPGPHDTPPLFTDYTYHYLGVPRNPDNAFYQLPAPFNHAGESYVDLGLGAVIGVPEELGKFKVPTLRNVAATAPYMHNGVFTTLREAIVFVTGSDGTYHPAPEFEPDSSGAIGPVRERGPAPRYPVPAPPTGGGSTAPGQGLTAAEIDALHAFLLTLTDGYQP